MPDASLPLSLPRTSRTLWIHPRNTSTLHHQQTHQTSIHSLIPSRPPSFHQRLTTNMTARCFTSQSRRTLDLPTTRCPRPPRCRVDGRGRCVRVMAVSSGEARGPTASVTPTTRVVALERVLEDVLFESRSGEGRKDWEEVMGAWVLRPASGTAQAIVHFMGGAFIGVAPQLAYRQFLEALADRNIIVVATPFSTHFDHLRSADETQFKFDAAYGQLKTENSKLAELPIFGVGHSLGSLLLVLNSSKYSVQRTGNVLMSFNNKPAQEVIPLLQQVAPAARFLRPVLTQAASFRSTAEVIRDAFNGMSPSLIRQVTPWAEQFVPLYFDMAQGNQEFTPAPDETRKRIKSYYGVRRNLLIKFNDDGADETDVLASLLQGSVVSSSLDLTVRALPGDHACPMQPTVVDLPPEVSRAANTAFNTGGGFINQLSKMAAEAGQSEGSLQLDRLSKGVSGMASAFSSESKGVFKSRVISLADEIAVWMGVGGVVAQGQKFLTAKKSNEP